ncbi:MAG: NUDIX hydrolase [Candidatus Magasanikbacteria bacterium]|nr:NUDIX hydrolase [Candidatus Magasanikbacteria bacterium]
MKIRTTGILIERDKILLLDQNVNKERTWSLPGGTLENGETLEECMIREMKEETGLDVSVGKLLYICDLIVDQTHVVHISFLVKKIGGTLGNISENLDTQKIRKVDMVPISKLEAFGFSKKFKKLVENRFPKSGTYMGSKSNIGL